MRYASNMAPSSMSIFTCVFLTIIGTCSAIESDIFSEELIIKPLPSGHVYAYFQFPIRWNVDLDQNDALRHFRLFPRSIGQIVTKHRVQELHLSLTQGRWRHKKWGYPLKDAPPGAELWAWFRHDTLE
ncbi:GPI transamidase component PIG-T-like [Centruroides sculpturatus]|uniref:GPI transamidase component PIG-T-like n=1 Tax=Centruroides sculpturatus TaxID=218467 RepID=UPI000C6E281C|nr:GPI transamidase component PIG-T-like [Centruroides sculpturatus]